MDEKYIEKLGYLKNVVERSQHIVCLMGVRAGSQCGCTNYRDKDDAYNIEAEYGYSPEEMFNSSFYNTRTELFYKFYKSHMISELGELQEGFQTLKRMEDAGKLKAIITRNIFRLKGVQAAGMYMRFMAVFTKTHVPGAAGCIRLSTLRTAGESPDAKAAVLLYGRGLRW